MLQNREINVLGTKNVKKWPKPSFASKIFTGAIYIRNSPLVAKNTHNTHTIFLRVEIFEKRI